MFGISDDGTCTACNGELGRGSTCAAGCVQRGEKAVSRAVNTFWACIEDSYPEISTASYPGLPVNSVVRDYVEGHFPKKPTPIECDLADPERKPTGEMIDLQLGEALYPMIMTLLKPEAEARRLILSDALGRPTTQSERSKIFANAVADLCEAVKVGYHG